MTSHSITLMCPQPATAALPTREPLRKWSLATAATFAVAALLAGCHAAPAPVSEVRPVYVSTVRNDGGAEERRFTGSIASRYEGELGFRVGGKVTARLVDLGQTVQRGQALARIDGTDYQLGADAAAEQLRAAQVDADQAASDAARFKRLLADGSVSAGDLERQQARADAAAARVQQARSQMEVARNRAGYTTLVAPNDGVVTAVRFEAGQVVAEGQSVLALARPGSLEVALDVPESLAPQLRDYQANVRLGTSTWPVGLRELSPSANAATRTFRARYTLPPAAAGVRLGSTVELRLSRGGVAQATTLPLSAVLSTQQRPTVWVVDSGAGRLVSTPVEVLSQTTESVRVRGLADGALVVSVGAQKIDAGLAVRPVARPLDSPVSVTAATGSSAAASVRASATTVSGPASGARR
jgi:RND family efflux transporter MFP subunit